MGLKILGRVGTHIFFLEKNIIICILKVDRFFFSENLKKILGFNSKFR